MLVSFAILFGTISVCISAIVVYSAVVVATRAQDRMKNLPAQSIPEFRYESRLSQLEAAPTLVAAS